MEEMTDKQYDGILQMIGMILDGCQNLEEAKKKIVELRKGKKMRRNKLKKTMYQIFKII